MPERKVYATTSVIIPYKFSESDVRRFVMVQERDTMTWGSPGGGIQPNDHDYLSACSREALEETGLTIVPTAFIGAYIFNSRHGNRVYNFALSAKIESGSLGTKRDADIADVRAMSLNEIRELHGEDKLRSGIATVRMIEDFIRQKELGQLIGIEQAIRIF